MNEYDERELQPAPLPRPGDLAGPAAGVARIAAAGGFHAARWGVRASIRTGRRVLAAATDPAVAVETAHGLGATVGTVTGLARAVARGVPVREALATAIEVEAETPERTASQQDRASLRERGAELLARSRDVWHEEGEHPAYARILGDLAPDEARVLLLLREGPQPSVDVRTGGPVGVVSSQLVAAGLTMVGARAGCRYVDRVPAYLDNLHRLGLVWFSREPLGDPMEYQVLEAQPDVLAALHAHRFTRVVRRSIHLTPFGEDFCRAVLSEPPATTPRDERPDGDADPLPGATGDDPTS